MLHKYSMLQNMRTRHNNSPGKLQHMAVKFIDEFLGLVASY